jgi:hypothetical protein
MTPPLRRPLHAAHRVATLAGPRLALFGVLALVACWYPLTRAGALNDFRDSHLLQSYEDAGTRTVTRYGQLPLWNPWACGGQYAPGSPQTRVASPTLLVSAALGARRAEPVVLWVFLVLGMEGFFRYARRRAGSALGALAAAPLFGLIGFTALSWSIGWLNFAGFLLLPWLLLGTRRAAQGRLSGVALVAGCFAFLLGFGGTYPVPMGALFVALEAGRTLYTLGGAARRRRALWALGATALFTLGACAFRLWPLVETMRSAPRVMAGTPGNSLETLARMLLQLPARSGHSDPGNFFVVPVALALVPVAVALGRRRALYPTVMAALCVWMAAGYTAKPSLFAGLRTLPIYETFRYPERFLLPAGLFIAELAALGLAALLVRAWRGRTPWAMRAAALACGVVVAGWGVQVHAFTTLTRWAPLVAEPPPTPPEAEQPFAQARGNRWAQGYFLALNRGSIACGEAWPVPMSERLRGDLPQEEYLEEPSSGTARRVEWTPNRVEVDVAAARPAVLLVNQNWHPGWKASVGEVVSRDGLLAVRLPEGEHRVVLRFLPRSGLGGALVSALSWAGLAWLAWRARRSGGVRWGAWALAVGAMPLLVWGVLPRVWSEPMARAVPRNADGSPMVLDSLPPGARPLGVRFDAPVELVAAEVPSAPDAEGIVHLALYWRVTGPVPRTAGIFVHLSGPEGSKRKNADHAVLGGTFFFREAPRDTLLRDAFAVSTRDWEAGEWKVLVGLWHAGGDGSRLEARGADGQPLHESRVEAGAFTVPPKSQSSGQP